MTLALFPSTHRHTGQAAQIARQLQGAQNNTDYQVMSEAVRLGKMAENVIQAVQYCTDSQAKYLHDSVQLPADFVAWRDSMIASLVAKFPGIEDEKAFFQGEARAFLKSVLTNPYLAHILVINDN